jgi:UDP-2,3-diacylglucosamine hydrolase
LETPDTLAIIAGNGSYPFSMVRGARKAGVKRIVVAAFTGETREELAKEVDGIAWMRVGQLGKLISFIEKSGARAGVMAGQIAPPNLFALFHADFTALRILAKLKRRNAETIFRAIGDEIAKVGCMLIPATSFMDDHLAGSGLLFGPKLKARIEDDLQYGLEIAKKVSELDIGQTVLVKNGTVLAVEGFEGTNECIKRGGALGRGDAVMVKVSKPGQDLRFDVPVIGPVTIEACASAGVRAIGIEAGETIVLERERVAELASSLRVAVFGLGR